MPLDGNDSGATWQGSPASPQPNPTHSDMNTPAVPQQAQHQATQLGNIPAHPTYPSDTWEPSLEDDFPPEPEEDVTPANVTPIRAVPAQASNTVVDGSVSSVPSINQGVSNAPLHISPTPTNNTTSQGKVSPSRASFSEQITHFSSLILIPFLFAVLTGLIILPQVASSRAYLPSQTLIPLIFILLVIGIAQGVGIYYAGTNNGLWAVSTLTGFFLFVLTGCFTLAGTFPAIALFIVIVILYIVLYRLYIHPVPAGFIEIVQAFGRYSRTLDAGFNILLPWEKATRPISIKETSWQTPPQNALISQNEDIVLQGSIIYQLVPQLAQNAVLDVNNWEENLHAIFVAKLHDIANSLTPNFIAMLRSQRNYLAHDNGTAPFIGDNRWRQVNELLLQQTQSRVSQWGVHIKDAQIFGVTLVAHTSASALIDEDTAPASYMQQEAAGVPSMQATSSPTVPEQPKQPSSQPQLNQAAPAEPALPASAFKEEALISAYRLVQSGSVKDPETIRGIAQRFEMVAKNPSLYQNVSFDAMRAANNLLKEADRREEELAARAGTLFNDETRPDMRKPEDESTFFGA